MGETRQGGQARAVPAWRLEWVGRENQRRLSEHAAAEQRWRADLTDLDEMLTAARHFEGVTTHPESSLELKKGERIYVALPLVTLMEETAPATRNLPHRPPFSFRDNRKARYTAPVAGDGAVTPPQGTRAIDRGTVTLTDRRVVFGGVKHREWAFSKLLGFEHSFVVPYTAMQVSNRQKISGVAYPPAARSAWRFNLALALAVFDDDRAALVADLERERQGLLALRPVPHPPALPQEAPSRGAAIAAVKGLYLGRPGQRPVRRLVQGTTASLFTLMALLVVIGAVAPKPTDANTTSRALAPAPSRDVSANSAAATDTTSTQASVPSTPPALAPSAIPPAPAQQLPPSAAATSRSSATSHASARAVPQPRPKPAPTHRVVAPAHTPAPKPSPTHAAKALCGAPSNPWGYTFCGGTYIYSPAAGICDYFSCIPNFPNGKGYVEQCADGMLSKSGGRQGACSHHGGERRPLFR